MKIVVLVLILAMMPGCITAPHEKKVCHQIIKSDTLEIVNISSTVSASLKLGENLMITVKCNIYSVNSAQIWVRPYTNGGRTPGYEAHSSPQYKMGKGRFVGWFRFCNLAEVDEIRIEMVSDRTKVVTSISKKIFAEWK